MNRFSKRHDGALVLALVAVPAVALAAAPPPSLEPFVQQNAPQSSSRQLSTARTQGTGRTVLVVDIDETLSITDYNAILWGIGSDDSTPLAGSQRAMQRLAQDYDIVYLTARPTSTTSKTQRWLDSKKFPKGRIVTSSSVGQFLSQGDFKKKALARLRREYPNMLIGIGDKAKDAEAYRANGMLAVIVNPWSSQKYHRGDLMLRTWDRVGEFFETNRELLGNAQRLADAISSRQVTLQVPGVRPAAAF